MASKLESESIPDPTFEDLKTVLSDLSMYPKYFMELAKEAFELPAGCRLPTDCPRPGVSFLSSPLGLASSAPRYKHQSPVKEPSALPFVRDTMGYKAVLTDVPVRDALMDYMERRRLQERIRSTTGGGCSQCWCGGRTADLGEEKKWGEEELLAPDCNPSHGNTYGMPYDNYGNGFFYPDKAQKEIPFGYNYGQRVAVEGADTTAPVSTLAVTYPFESPLPSASPPATDEPTETTCYPYLPIPPPLPPFSSSPLIAAMQQSFYMDPYTNTYKVSFPSPLRGPDTSIQPGIRYYYDFDAYRIPSPTPDLVDGRDGRFALNLSRESKITGTRREVEMKTPFSMSTNHDRPVSKVEKKESWLCGRHPKTSSGLPAWPWPAESAVGEILPAFPGQYGAWKGEGDMLLSERGYYLLGGSRK